MNRIISVKEAGEWADKVWPECVKQAYAEQPAQQQQGPGNLKHLAEICPELNMSNYTIDDVDELNNWAIEVATAIDAMAEQPAPVQQILSAFPLLDDGGLDQEEHHCEWTLQQDRKRLHAMLAAAPQPAQQEPSDLDVWRARALQAEAVIEKFMAEQPAQQQEPVAWALYQRDRLLSFWMDKGDAYDFEFTTEHRWEPLYTSPPAQRKPLTVKEIAEFVGTHEYGPDQLKWFRLGEAAHGIKDNQ